jgi:hypothetical protein
VNTFNLPSTINSVTQGGRVSTALQVGANVVLPAVRTATTVSGAQVLSNYQTATSADGVTFTFASLATPDLTQNVVPTLLLPSGTVVFKRGYTLVNSVSVPNNFTYAYTTDGYTLVSTTDLMFINPIQAAYSPTLRRLVVFRQESNTSTFANTGVTIGTLDFP